MRTTIAGCVTLLLCCLVASGCRARRQVSVAVAQPPPPPEVVQVVVAKVGAVNVLHQPAKAEKEQQQQQPKPKKDNAKPAPSPVWSVEVKGWGVNVDAAEKHALTKAEDLLRAHLQSQKPPLAWHPTADFIRKNLMTTQPKRCTEDENVQVAGQTLECWCWTVSVSPGSIEAMRREEARERARLAVEARAGIAEERMVELSKLLAWAVLALTGLFTYIRVDDWTKGAQRRWLRFALGSLLLSGGVGWWLLS